MLLYGLMRTDSLIEPNNQSFATKLFGLTLKLWKKEEY